MNPLLSGQTKMCDCSTDNCVKCYCLECGYTLLSESPKICYVCVCGQKHEKNSLYNLKRSICSMCIAKERKYSDVELVKIGSKWRVKYTCLCGESYNKDSTDFNKDTACKNCVRLKLVHGHNVKFNNYKIFLEEMGFVFDINAKDFYATKTVEYKCQRGHVSVLTHDSFRNKMTHRDEIRNFCAKCQQFEIWSEEVKECSGNDLVNVLGMRKCSYICGSCGEVAFTHINNLLKKSPGEISFCMGSAGFELVDYENCKNLTMRCKEGHVFTASTHDIAVRNRGCPECAPKRRADTNIEKYGSANVMHNADIAMKAIHNCYSVKEYTLPSGIKIKLRGYEPLCLDLLVKQYPEDAIETDASRMPVFLYFYGGINHRYYPDIMLIDGEEVKFIEVKSTWTYLRDYEINHIKLQSVKTAGFPIELWIMDESGEVLEII